MILRASWLGEVRVVTYPCNMQFFYGRSFANHATPGLLGLHLLILISTYWCPLPDHMIHQRSDAWHTSHDIQGYSVYVVVTIINTRLYYQPNMRSCSCVVTICCREVRPGAQRHGLHHRLLARQLQELQLLRPLPHHHGIHASHLSHVSAN